MRTYRTDIQALRAIAILLVVGFHVWPAAVTGGYVGVDVFFVISGYLITALLLREVASTGWIDLPTFYGRRAWRLLPAASLTLTAAAIASYLWMPASTWATTAADMAASALYAENWMLVRRSVDYLAHNQPPSPLQHFWSLSVEEQFYLGWPLLVAWGGRRGAGGGGKVGGGPATTACAMAAVCVASFVTSLYYAHADTALGYFLTATRLWEMGVGGLVAAWSATPMAPKAHIAQGPQPDSLAAGASTPSLPSAWLASWTRTAGTVVGLAAILGSGALYTPQVPFPGAAALVPVLGAAAFIMAGDVKEGEGETGGGATGEATGPAAVTTAIAAVLSHPFLQYIGDLSYSLYLAHWPVVVLFPHIAGRPVDESGWSDGLNIVLASWALAHACKRGWEDRFRNGPLYLPEDAGTDSLTSKSPHTAKWRPTHKHALILAVACMGSTLASSACLALQVTPWLKMVVQRSSVVRFQDNAGQPGDIVHATYPGAEAWALDAPHKLVSSILNLTDVIPSIDAAVLDYGTTSTSPGNLCLTGFDGSKVQPCPPAKEDDRADRSPPLTRPHLVLLGDSHAAHWLPALQAAAQEGNWTATAINKILCMPANVTVDLHGKPYTSCQEWLKNAVSWIIAKRPTAVIMSASSHYTASSANETSIASGVAQVAQAIAAAKIPVLAIKHTPYHRQELPTCLAAAQARKLDTVAATQNCTSPISDVLIKNNIFSMAARQFRGLRVLDFNDLFCDAGGACPPIIGNVMVYRDEHHLTATYAESLAAALRRRLVAALPGVLL